MGQMRLEHRGHLGASIWNFEGSPNSPGAQGPEVSGETGAGSTQIAERWPGSQPWFCLPFPLPLSSRPVYLRVNASCVSASLSGGELVMAWVPPLPPPPPRGPGSSAP